jgi:hypothetical protein
MGVLAMGNWDRQLRKVRRGIEDVTDEAGDAYENLREEVSRRAGQVWRNREDYVDDAFSLAEEASDAVYRRMRADPLGTIAIGILLFWLIGRTVRR